jgi:peptide/nickel transport system substrate-binding protein
MLSKRPLSLIAMATGLSLLVAATFAAGASSKPISASAAAKKGGTLNVNMSNTDIDFTDPALAYFVYSWQLLSTTCSMLVSFPDKPAPVGSVPVPEGAAGMPVISKDGKTYTFTVRKNLKFADGKPVTAANYAFAFNRDLNPAINSPATQYMHEIVGADDVLAKKATTATGIVATGNKLTIKLTSSIPDFLSRVALPFFCPLPLSTQTTAQGVDTFPGSGPYTITSRIPNREIVVSTNKFYNGSRPHNFDKMVYTPNVDLNQSLLQVKSGEADYDAAGLPPTAHADLGKEFKINKTQYWVHPQLETDFVAMRTDRGPLTDVNVRKAVNWAMDRPQFLRARGAFAGARDDQLLNPGFPFYKDLKIYSFKGANPDQAKKLLAKSTTCKDGCKLTLYTGNAGAFATQGQILQYNLKQIGIDLSVQQFSRSVEKAKCGTRAEQFDLCIDAWGADYPDAVTFIVPLLSGKNLVETNNTNEAYFNNPTFNKMIDAAAAMTGDARNKAFSKIDQTSQIQFAPYAPFLHRNAREFTSSRLDPKCYVYQPVYQAMDVATACLK